jgi:hypothetical protein
MEKFFLNVVASFEKCAILAGSAFETCDANQRSRVKKKSFKSFDTAFKFVSQSKASLIAAGQTNRQLFRFINKLQPISVGVLRQLPRF